VEDSAVVREMLCYLIGNDHRLEVAACAGSGEEAIRLLARVRPDVISLDIRLPGMNGLEMTRRVMADHPTPIVVVSSAVESEDLQISINALRAGALSIVEKPVGLKHCDYARLAEQLCGQLALMSRVKVIRQRIDRGLRFGEPEEDLRPNSSDPSPAAPLPEGRRGAYEILGIAASTGGPAAMQTVLTALGPNFPLPILLVQHIADDFSNGFVSWLGGVVRPLPVKMAKGGEQPRAGSVYVAPADRHLEFVDGCLALTKSPKISGQRPSATVLFQSMARSLGSAALAVVLTGMGDDGAIGLKDIYDAGGRTIAEDSSTAVVYGMPKAAAELGAVGNMLPLDRIGPRLREISLAERR
jgi:two-component system chemotaxis response regulator CheB